jgi:prepilin-type N-terminal cleavage/methylation domain-containing protein
MTQHKLYTGFTIVELMIVMTIMALMTALVGPLALNSIERADAKNERLKVEQAIVRGAQRAFTSGKQLELQLDGKNLKLIAPGEQGELLNLTFKYIFFQPQNIHFTHSGLSTTKIITASYRQRTYEIDVSRLLTRTKEFKVEK